jgi:Ca2+-binding RTX toxin-like protein
VTINGGGGDDGVSFASASAPVVVNLSGSLYAVPIAPPGLTDAGATVPADTAVGGVGGLSTPITLSGISNVMGTAKGSDIIIAGPGSGTLVGGTGNDTFVPTGGNDVINGGTGTDTLDLSLLPSYSTFNLGSAAPQNLGVGDGSLAVVPGTIEKIIASPSGSTLQAGPGNITLVGGQGNDTLEAGTGTQTLMAGTGDDTLVAGIGTDKLIGGPTPVTFVPGQGSDTLTSQLTSAGNTLSYQGSPGGAQVNLSGQLYVSLNLAANTAIGGWGAGATVSLAGAQILQVIGSPEADTFITGSTPVNVAGGGGSDTFVVNSGGNTLTAGTGSASRFLIDATGNNIINGGGSSTLDFSLAPTGVDVDLGATPEVASGGFGGTQSLTGIQNVIGTNSADVLIAGAKGQTLTGGNGGDLLEASAAGGDTLISGGNGNDTFCAQVGCNHMTVAAGGNTMTGGSGDDSFFARNGGPDTITGHAGDVAQIDTQDKVIGFQGIPPP